MREKNLCYRKTEKPKNQNIIRLVQVQTVKILVSHERRNFSVDLGDCLNRCSFRRSISLSKYQASHGGHDTAVQHPPWDGWAWRSFPWRSTDDTWPSIESRTTRWAANGSVNESTNASRPCWPWRTSGYPGWAYDGNDARRRTSRRCIRTDAECTCVAALESTNSSQSNVPWTTDAPGNGKQSPALCSATTESAASYGTAENTATTAATANTATTTAAAATTEWWNDAQ